MDAEEFRKYAKEAVDYIVDYHESIRNRPVLPSVETGYLHKLIPSEAPDTPDEWSSIIPDIERYIQPGMTHWNSPSFNAYYPGSVSYPSILGDLLSSGMGSVGFNWILCPASTELEVIVLDWLAKLFDLPKHFLAESNGPGGGIVQGSGSEGILVALLTAKDKKVREHLPNGSEEEQGLLKAKFVAYSSDQSNSAVEKAALLGAMMLTLVRSNPDGTINTEALKTTIRKDKEKGLIPCYLVATLGTTATCAYDDIEQIGKICKADNIWLHVDGAYAGGALVCPEFKHLGTHLNLADSYNMNPHKWFLVNFDCSCFWIRDKKHLLNAFTVDRDYLKDNYNEIMQQNWAPTFRNWEIPLGRRFRALKLWTTLRLFGKSGLQAFIRKHVNLAKRMESKILSDPRFEIFTPATMGLVCFRIKGEEKLSKELLTMITDSKVLFMNGAAVHGRFFLRYALCSALTEPADVDQAWNIISEAADVVLKRMILPNSKGSEFASEAKNYMKPINSITTI